MIPNYNAVIRPLGPPGKQPTNCPPALCEPHVEQGSSAARVALLPSEAERSRAARGLLGSSLTHPALPFILSLDIRMHKPRQVN